MKIGIKLFTCSLFYSTIYAFPLSTNILSQLTGCHDVDYILLDRIKWVNPSSYSHAGLKFIDLSIDTVVLYAEAIIDGYVGTGRAKPEMLQEIEILYGLNVGMCKRNNLAVEKQNVDTSTSKNSVSTTSKPNISVLEMPEKLNRGLDDSGLMTFESRDQKFYTGVIG